MNSQYEDILVEHHDNGVSLFTINRESRRNALRTQTALELEQAFKEFDESDQRVAIIAGAGTASFCAGADVEDIPELWRCVPTVGITTEKPIICAVSGWCVGGGLVIAMMSDLVVAAENSQFYYPEAKLGIAQGMIASLAARIPHKIAMELMLLARKIDAQRAYNCGLANLVVPNGRHVEAAREMADEIAELAPLALKLLKRYVTEEILPKGPTEYFGRAKRAMGVTENSEDFQEGIRAFKEKRKPVFHGR